MFGGLCTVIGEAALQSELNHRHSRDREKEFGVVEPLPITGVWVKQRLHPPA